MKLRKFFMALILSLVFAFGGLTLSACGEDKEIESMTIEGISKIVELDTTENAKLDYSGVLATLNYSDSTRTIASIDELEFSEIDLSKLGEQDLTITHKQSGKQVTIKIRVVENTSNSFVTEYSSPLLTNTSKGNISDEFASKERGIKAGDDNAFDLQIKAKAIADITSEVPTKVDVNNPYTDLIVEVKEGDTYVDGMSYVDIVGTKIDFRDNAVGKSFRIFATPRYIAEGYEENIEPLVYTLDVVDGYNVYTAKDLSVMCNVDELGWKEFKKSIGLENVEANALVLQSDINITDRDLPSKCFYSASEAQKFGSHPGLATYKSEVGENGISIEGSLKDYLNIYNRIYKNANETFAIYGNYFQINYKDLSIITIEGKMNTSTEGSVKPNKYLISNESDPSKEQLITTHTTLFRVGTLNDDVAKAETNRFIMQDVDFVGNGERTDSARESGGTMIFKMDSVNCDVDNTLYKGCFIGYMINGGKDATDKCVYKITNTKGYNCYNTLLYVWGGKNVLIENSEFVGAGGPVMIVDHVDDKAPNGGYPSGVTVINSKLESFVNGNEPWFHSYGATALVSQIVATNKSFTDNGSTFVVSKKDSSGKPMDNMFNLKVVYKSASAEGLTSRAVRGNVTFFDTRAQYEAQTRDTNPIISSYGLDMDTYSQEAIDSKNNITTNSKFGGNMEVIGYFVYNNYVFKLADIESVLANASKPSVLGTYIQGQVANVDGAQIIQLLSGEQYVLDKTNGVVKTQSGETLSDIVTMSQGGMSADTFNLVSQSEDFAKVSETGSTDVNFYIFNGMAIVLELFKLDK